MTPTNIELLFLVPVMLDSSDTSPISSFWASHESANNLSMLGDLSLSFDSGVSVATTLVEDILSEFPITQDWDLLDSTSTTSATFGLHGSESEAYYPYSVLDSASDGAPHGPHLDSNTLSKSVEETTIIEAVPRSEATRREKLKELWEKRFTRPYKMKPHYTSEGRY